MAKKIVNYVLAKSTRSEIRTLKKASKAEYDYVFSFDSVLPTPVSLLMLDHLPEYNRWGLTRRAIRETGFESKAEWQKSCWGVSQDVTDTHEREGDMNYWMVKFDTIDNPPVQAFQKLSERFQKITFLHRYFNLGTSSAGEVFYSFGNPTRETRYQGASFKRLTERLKIQGIYLSIDSGTLKTGHYSNFPIEYNDPFSNIFGGTFEP